MTHSIHMLRMPGLKGSRSLHFIEQLKTDGEDEQTVKLFDDSLALFESLSIIGTFDDAMKAFPVTVDIKYQEFLQGLHHHIRCVCRAERASRLHEIGYDPRSSLKDQVAAMKLLGDFDKK